MEKDCSFQHGSAAPLPLENEFRAITLTGNDRAVITGTTLGDTNFPTSQNAFQRTAKGWADVFVATLSPRWLQVVGFNSAGRLLRRPTRRCRCRCERQRVYWWGNWVNRLSDHGWCVSQDARHDPVRCPRAMPRHLHAEASTRLQPASVFNLGLAVREWNFPPKVAIDGVGHVYVAGTPSPGHPLVKAIQSEWRQLYLTKLNTGGSALLFSTYFGGTLGLTTVVNF